jgi:PAS domain S-box-containing protein
MLIKKQPKDYKRKYAEAKNKFDIVFNLTSAASKILNADLTILKVNEALIELLGFPATEIEGTKILDYVCPEYRQGWHELQQALWRKNLPFFKLEACLIWIHDTG